MNRGFLLSALLLLIAACASPINAEDVDQFSLEEYNIAAGDTINGSTANLSNTLLQERIESSYFDPQNVIIVQSDQVEWSDSCLGIEQPGMECIPQSTPGYQVTLKAKGLQFVVHSDKVGSNVKPATPGLLWTREGGEQEICDRLVIYLPDSAIACWCQSGEIKSASVNLQEVLSPEEFEQLIKALRAFSENTINEASPNGTPTVMTSMTFFGQGTQFPTSEEQQFLFSLAEAVFTRITP